MSSMTKFLFYVEGPIGIGKSSILRELKMKGHVVYYEPVLEWANGLKEFYQTEQTPEQVIQFQKNIYQTMHNRQHQIVNDWKMHNSTKVVFAERSLFSSVDVFAAIGKKIYPLPIQWNRAIDEMEDLIQEMAYKTETAGIKENFIHLSARDPQIAINRSRERGYSDIFASEKYHEEVHLYCKKFQKKRYVRNAENLILDAEKSIDVNINAIDSFVNKICK